MQGILFVANELHYELKLACPTLVGDWCQYFLTVLSLALCVMRVWCGMLLILFTSNFSCLSLYWCVSMSPTVKFGEWIGEVWWSDPRICFPLQRDIAAVCARTLSHHCHLHSCYTGDFTHMYTWMTHAPVSEISQYVGKNKYEITTLQYITC